MIKDYHESWRWRLADTELASRLLGWPRGTARPRQDCKYCKHDLTLPDRASWELVTGTGSRDSCLGMFRSLPSIPLSHCWDFYWKQVFITGIGASWCGGGAESVSLHNTVTSNPIPAPAQSLSLYSYCTQMSWDMCVTNILFSAAQRRLRKLSYLVCMWNIDLNCNVTYHSFWIEFELFKLFYKHLSMPLALDI